VLVVDRHVLLAIHRLHFLQQVALQVFLAIDPQDVVRNERAFDQRRTGLDLIARVYQELLVLRHVVLALHAALRLDDDGHLARRLSG
jgi:hypothetical protein